MRDVSSAPGTRSGRAALCLSLIAGALVLAAARPAFAIGEQVGRVRGVVIETESRRPLVAATVEASGEALIGAPRRTLTDERGRYELVNLPPGKYLIRFSYEGLAPLERLVAVRVSETTPLNVSWSLTAAGVEGVELTETRKLTRPDSAQTGSVVDTTVLKKLPTARSYQDAAQKVGGVSGGANPNIKGGYLRLNKFLVDGLDVTDPVTGTFSLNMPFEALSTIDVQTGGLEAQYNAMGGVINVITKGGADKIMAVGSIYVNHSKLSGTGDSGSQLYEDRSPFRETPTGPNQSLQATLNAGGPIVPRMLWFRATYDVRLRESSPARLAPLGTPPYDIQHPANKAINHLISARVSFAPSAKHLIWLSNNISPGKFDNQSGGNLRLGIAETHQNQNSIFHVLGWDWYLTDRITTNIQGGLLYQNIETGPQGWLGKIDYAGCDKPPFQGTAVCQYDRNNFQHTNSTDGSVWFQGGAYQNDTRWKVQIDPSISIRANALGKHDIKAGVQLVYNDRSREIRFPGRRDPNKPTGTSYYDVPNRNLPLETGLCDPDNPDPAKCYLRYENDDVYATQKAYGLGVYVQDRWWTPLEWLTVLPGMRFDYGRTYDRKGRVVTSLFTPGLGPAWLKLTPRLGVTANLTSDGRNVAFAHYGRNTEVLSLATASSVDSTEGSVEREYEYTPGHADPVTGEWRKISETGGEGGVVVDKNAKTPHSDEVTVGFRREVFTSSAASIEFTYKRFNNMWAYVEKNQIWDPTGSRVVGYHQTKPNLQGEQEGYEIWHYGTPDDHYRTYYGMTLLSEGDPSPRWHYSTSYTLSWLYGPAVAIFGANPFDNPRQAKFFNGFNPEDIRHYFRAYGSYDFSRYFTAGAAFEYRTGFPLTKAYYNHRYGGNSNYRSPIGTAPSGPNDIERISELRTPDQVDFDVRLTFNLLPNKGLGDLLLGLDFFNVLDLRTATGTRTADNAQYGQVTGRKTPRRLQLSLTYEY